MTDEQTPAERITAAMEKLKTAAENAGHTFTVQGAMGWMWRGDLEQARTALRKLPPERLHEVSAAAAALSALADEVATETGAGQ